MLVSGVGAGIAFGIAFGGDWRRLGTLDIKWWPLLLAASVVRLATALFPDVGQPAYVLGLVGIGIVAARNWRQAGAALIAVGTFANVLVVLANAGMPYDHLTAVS